MNRLTDDIFLYRAITKKQWLDRDREINEKAFTLRFLKNKQRWEKGLSCDLVEKKSYQYINECFGIIKLSVKDIKDLGLDVDNDHDTHVNIISLPDPDLQKQESKDIAVKLAKKAILHKDWLDNPYKKSK